MFDSFWNVPTNDLYNIHMHKKKKVPKYIQLYKLLSILNLSKNKYQN